jgi:hypothetical protein
VISGDKLVENSFFSHNYLNNRKIFGSVGSDRAELRRLSRCHCCATPRTKPPHSAHPAVTFGDVSSSVCNKDLVGMTAHEAFWLWYDFSHIACSAVSHLQHSVDSDDPCIDWDRQREAMCIAGLAFACSILEARKVSREGPHAPVLTSLRNASLHNGGHLDRNRDHPRSINLCRDYLDTERWQLLNAGGGGVTEPFKVSTDGLVTLSSGAFFFFIERVLDSFQSSAERSRPAPLRPVK